ncbi:hypothetical protein [Aeromicrobium endophyticum]|uniref:LPXTG cell wall anchor domain-containing protein n=1 Tax=Aeromicrobium endophyticum TaxID=2292704 RepID=A0A371PC34_9ACTN|nr:hypothetical protein [Aeromicrobium endophyticum]REK72970.1 hypothetical protein DX116_05085 [Aeromicrobium endophyticum]
MKRTLSTALAAASLVVVTIGLAQPAQAITNPADNPRPITVKGDDGKTYTDGEDTLPGYDDEACTYIPGAYFDFDNNRVRYADGQSIPWTEWERATGYKEWKAKQSKPAAPATPKATTPAAAKTPAPKPTKPKPAATAKPASSGKSAAGTPSSATPEPTASATPSDDVDAAGTDEKAAAEEPTSEPSTAPEEATATDEADEVALASDESETTKASAEESDGTGSAGLLILAGLAGAGALAYAGYTVVARRKGQAS